jgi:hypothetical protein
VRGGIQRQARLGGRTVPQGGQGPALSVAPETGITRS